VERDGRLLQGVDGRTERVVGDYALALIELWDALWASGIGPTWLELAPDDQTAEDRDADPSPRVCWRNEWLTRCHRRGHATLYTCVCLEREQVFLGVGVFGPKGKNLLHPGPAGYELDPDTELFWQTTSSRIGTDGILDGAELVKARDAALTAVDEAIALSPA